MLAPHKRYKTALMLVVQDVNKALDKIYPGKKIWKSTDVNSGRLSRLLVWSERYGVPLEYVLEVILGYCYAVLPKGQQFKAKTSKALGVSIATLTGKQSLAILQEQLQKDFPDGNNMAAYKEEEKEKIITLMDSDLPAKARSVLHYGSMSKFVQAYASNVERQKTEADKLERKMKKIAWRNNPWK